MQSHELVLSAFWVVAVAHVAACAVDSPKVAFATKPALMPLLLAYYALVAASFSRLVAAALVAGFLGDVFLLWKDDQTKFLAGLASFLLGHVAYASAFLAATDWGNVPPWAWLLAPALAAFGFLVVRQLGDLGPFKAPVVVYVAVILFASLAEGLMGASRSAAAFAACFGGAVLFVSSDATIAFDKFKAPVPRARVWIMSTYVAAQFLLVWGYLLVPSL
ncbi:MAG: hypothetical protein Kow0069_22360 [Promethearchaeota archaeon]